jgi:hypothetical protein
MSITMPPMIDPVTPLQTHSSLEIHNRVQTHTMLEKTTNGKRQHHAGNLGRGGRFHPILAANGRTPEAGLECGRCVIVDLCEFKDKNLTEPPTK